ncbi:MAG: general secretion pathway protein GspK [Helicobacteraceae bacterium]|nr:general secretion pathway protein GspK [Helicobacteraceae bacterium]
MSFKNAKNGFALSIVLWIVAALMLVALLVALFSKDTVTLSNGVEQKMLARLEAHSVLEKLKFYIATSNYDNNSLVNEQFSDLGVVFPSQIILDGRWYELSEHKRIKIQDSSGMFNLLSLNPLVFARYMSDDRALQNTIRDSIEDWLDSDDEIRLSGAETPFYTRQKGVSYHPSNLYRLQHPSELELINGLDTFSPDLLQVLRDHTHFANPSALNLMLLDAKMLASVLQIPLSYAQTLVNLRSESLRSFLEELRTINTYNSEMMSLAISKQFIIEIEVEHKNAKALLKTTIDFKPTEHFFYTVISEQNY